MHIRLFVSFHVVNSTVTCKCKLNKLALNLKWRKTIANNKIIVIIFTFDERVMYYINLRDSKLRGDCILYKHYHKASNYFYLLESHKYG